MIYESKKNNEIRAKLIKESSVTVILEYVSGPDVGKTITITTGTLKRWWSKSTEDILNLDNDKINEPYAPEVTPHYIPKPQSVIDYEAKKNKRYMNSDLPEFEQIVDTFGSILKSSNEKSKYVKFQNKSTLWRKSTYIDMYVTEDYWSKLTECGLTSKPNKDKDRPFAFRISNSDEYAIVVKALIEEEN